MSSRCKCTRVRIRKYIFKRWAITWRRTTESVANQNKAPPRFSVAHVSPRARFYFRTRDTYATYMSRGLRGKNNRRPRRASGGAGRIRADSQYAGQIERRWPSDPRATFTCLPRGTVPLYRRNYSRTGLFSSSNVCRQFRERSEKKARLDKRFPETIARKRRVDSRSFGLTKFVFLKVLEKRVEKRDPLAISSQAPINLISRLRQNRSRRKVSSNSLSWISDLSFHVEWREINNPDY